MVSLSLIYTKETRGHHLTSVPLTLFYDVVYSKYSTKRVKIYFKGSSVTYSHRTVKTTIIIQTNRIFGSF